MIVDMQSNSAMEGVLIFPDWAFGSPPPTASGAPGTGGPVRELKIIKGDQADSTMRIGGNANNAKNRQD